MKWMILLALVVVSIVFGLVISGDKSSVSSGSNKDETDSDPRDDEEEEDCRCSVPGGSCCWK